MASRGLEKAEMEGPPAFGPSEAFEGRASGSPPAWGPALLSQEGTGSVRFVSVSYSFVLSLSPPPGCPL